MDRIYAASASTIAPSLPASPSAGYPQSGNPATSTPATKPGAYWFHMITESLMNVVENGGVTPDPADFTQVYKAIINSTYEVGDYLHTDGRNPNTRWPWQTWVLIGAGQTLVNLDATDSAIDTAGKTTGSKTSTIGVTNLPSADLGSVKANHSTNSNGGGAVANGYMTGDIAGGSVVTMAQSKVNLGGSDTPLSVMQPSRATNIWRRTA